MQELAVEARVRHAVLRVAEDGMPDGQEVRADLVRAAGLQAHLSSVASSKASSMLEVGDRLARVVGVGRHARAAAAVAAERRVDRARRAPAGGP